MGKKKYTDIEYQIIIHSIIVTPLKSAKTTEDDDLKFIESALHRETRDSRKRYCKWKNGKKEGIVHCINKSPNLFVIEPIEILEFSSSFVVDHDTGSVEKKDDFTVTLYEAVKSDEQEDLKLATFKIHIHDHFYRKWGASPLTSVSLGTTANYTLEYSIIFKHDFEVTRKSPLNRSRSSSVEHSPATTRKQASRSSENLTSSGRRSLQWTETQPTITTMRASAKFNLGSHHALPTATNPNARSGSFKIVTPLAELHPEAKLESQPYGSIPSVPGSYKPFNTPEKSVEVKAEIPVNSPYGSLPSATTPQSSFLQNTLPPVDDVRRVSGMNMLTLVQELHTHRKGTESPYATLPTIEPQSYPPSVRSLFPEKKEDNYYYNPLADDVPAQNEEYVPTKKTYAEIPKEEVLSEPQKQNTLQDDDFQITPVYKIPVNKQDSYGQIPKAESVYKQTSYESIPKAPVSFESFMERLSEPEKEVKMPSSPTMEKPRVMNEIPAFSLDESSSSRYGGIPKSVDAFMDHPRPIHLEAPPSTPSHVESNKKDESAPNRSAYGIIYKVYEESEYNVKHAQEWNTK